MAGDNHYKPKLHKRLVLSHADYTVYSVNAFAVRNVAQPDEEFGNFATQEEFQNLIPKGEIWIAEKSMDAEGLFFIANALTRLQDAEREITAMVEYLLEQLKLIQDQAARDAETRRR